MAKDRQIMLILKSFHSKAFSIEEVLHEFLSQTEVESEFELPWNAVSHEHLYLCLYLI